MINIIKDAETHLGTLLPRELLRPSRAEGSATTPNGPGQETCDGG